MQAIILAAGMGKRLKDLTQDRTKCMVEVNGEKLIDRTLRILTKLGLNRIVVVIGYKGDDLKQYIIDQYDVDKYSIVFVENTDYSTTNNIVSLKLALDKYYDDDTLLLESDVIFDEQIIHDLISCNLPNVALVDKYESWMDGTVTILEDPEEPECTIKDIVFKSEFKYSEADNYYKTVNLYKFSAEYLVTTYIPFLEAYVKTNPNSYYEEVIKVVLGLKGKRLYAMKVKSDQKWYEIDDVQDLNIASIMFSETSEIRYQKLCKCYGGYWRYPKLKDYCYLVNPYFPTPEFYEEMKYNFSRLSSQYPSGSKVMEELIAKDFDLDPNTIVVGNGASEIIPHIVNSPPNGNVGIKYPTFEEYPNRLLTKGNKRGLKPIRGPLNISSDEYIELLKKSVHEDALDSIIVINPDNPSGSLIEHDKMIELVQWCEDNRVVIIVDESFIDFTDKPQSIMTKEFIAAHKNLVIVKSISKSHGVAGLRLGFITTSNESIRNSIKSKMPIWNINSFAEFYLQIYSKYEKDFKEGCRKLAIARKSLTYTLIRILGIKNINLSQANFLLIEFEDYINTDKLAAALLDKGFFVKSCASKRDLGPQFMRVAVRTMEENYEFSLALQSLLSEL